MNIAAEIPFFWNGRRLRAQEGDTLAAALYRNGVTVMARSRKLHRPLGYSGSYAAGVLARVDGRPNVRLDQEICKAGMNVEAQNAWPWAGFDLLSATQAIPSRWVYGGFEHARWAPSAGRAYLAWERMLANLAGVAKIPDTSLPAVARAARRLQVDMLVVGGGPAGCAAANDAASSGQSVALVTRGLQPMRFALSMGEPSIKLHPNIQAFPGTELFGCYREGKLLVAAPHRHDGGTIAFDARQVVLATGRRSMPPAMRGSHVPGVMDAHAALMLAAHRKIMPGRRIAVAGTGAETRVAERLQTLGGNVVHVGSISEVGAVHGRRHVRGIDAGRFISCDCLVHAGPWHADPSLHFQIAAEGHFQLLENKLPTHVSCVGSITEGDEAVVIRSDLSPETLICPCMDVTAGELIAHIDRGETDPEVLKRLTSCGMGPCQGYPCWENMLAVLSWRTGLAVEAFRRPSHRPPRRALTVAQAAGLCDVVEPDR